MFNHVSVVTAEELSDCKVGNFGVVLGRVLPVCGSRTSCKEGDCMPGEPTIEFYYEKYFGLLCLIICDNKVCMLQVKINFRSFFST